MNQGLERPLRLASLTFLSLFYEPLLSRLSRSESVMCFARAQSSQNYSLNRTARRLVGDLDPGLPFA
jgi:hypothetical protein